MSKLSEVVTIISGKNQKAVQTDSGQYPIYGSGGMMGRASDYLCEAGTTIVGRKGTINKPIYVSERFWNVDTAFGITPNEKLLSKYLYFFCLSFNFKKLDKSTTIPSLAKRDLLDIDIPVPSLTEQQRIVAKIEELFSELDNSVAALKRTQQQLRSYQQSVINSYFADSNKLVISTLGEYISSIESGKSFKCIETPPQTGECGIIKVSAVTWGEFNENESKTCKTDQFISKRAIHKGDFLFSRANTLQLIGNCVIVKHIEKELMLSDKILRFNFTDNIYPLYMLYFLRSQMGKSQIRTLSSGNQDGMRNIGQERIKKIQFPARTKEEQLQIASSIEAKLSACKKIEATISQTLQQAESLRQSILKQAFEGKLV